MIGWGGGVRVFALAEPADLRRGFDGLAALVHQRLRRDPTSGDLFLFVSRDRVRAKLLRWDGTGLCLYSKRLERGRFAAPWEKVREGQVELTVSELALFLEGCSEVMQRRLSPAPVDPKEKLYMQGGTR